MNAQNCAADLASTAASSKFFSECDVVISVTGPRLAGVAEEGSREATEQQQVPPQQSGQGTPHETAAATSAQCADASVQVDTLAEPSTPLTRKRSRREDELAGEPAPPGPAAGAAAADSGRHLQRDTATADAGRDLQRDTAAVDTGGDVQRDSAPSEEQNGTPHDGVLLPEDDAPGARSEGGQAAPGNASADQVQVLCPDLLHQSSFNGRAHCIK